MENKKFLKMLHDLNNALCACSGFTEMLLDKEDREYQKKVLLIVRGDIIKMGDILENYRELATKELKDIDEDHLDSTSNV